MRLYTVIVVSLIATSIVGLGKTTAFADTVTKSPVVKSQAQPQVFATVQEGDSLSTIATTYNTTYIRIFDANSQIEDPDLIYPGEVLRIPSTTEQLVDRSLPSDDSVAVQTDQQAVDESVTPPAPSVSPPANSSDSSVWYDLADCESGGNWAIDTGNGFYGGLQFTLSSWEAVGGSGYPNQASPAEQITRAQLLQSEQGWGAWPVCSAKLGL